MSAKSKILMELGDTAFRWVQSLGALGSITDDEQNGI